MDYHRIYRAFIEDRKGKLPEGYFEEHHVLPRSRGGSNDASNIIRLSAEDHFFAHLLLAKMYGGGMWTALRIMRWGRASGERPWVAGRYMYGVARRRHAEQTSARCKGRMGARGSDNGRYDAGKLVWTSLDTGEQLAASKWEMWDRFGGCRAHWTSAANGARKTHRGWTARPEQARIRGNKGKSARFVHHDGSVFIGTQTEFGKLAGISGATACRVVRNGAETNGWRLDSSCLPPRAATA